MPGSAIEGHRLQEFTCERQCHPGFRTGTLDGPLLASHEFVHKVRRSASDSVIRWARRMPPTADSSYPCAHKPWRGTFFADTGHCRIVSYCKKLPAKGHGVELFHGGRPMPHNPCPDVLRYRGNRTIFHGTRSYKDHVLWLSSTLPITLAIQLREATPLDRGPSRTPMRLR
jgi:hypothetical protein